MKSKKKVYFQFGSCVFFVLILILDIYVAARYTRSNIEFTKKTFDDDTMEHKYTYKGCHGSLIFEGEIIWLVTYSASILGAFILSFVALLFITKGAFKENIGHVLKWIGIGTVYMTVNIGLLCCYVFLDAPEFVISSFVVSKLEI